MTQDRNEQAQKGEATRPVDWDAASTLLWDLHSYTNEYIRFADTKAAFIATACTALIGSLVASSTFDSCCRRSLNGMTGYPTVRSIGAYASRPRRSREDLSSGPKAVTMLRLILAPGGLVSSAAAGPIRSWPRSPFWGLVPCWRFSTKH